MARADHLALIFFAGKQVKVERSLPDNKWEKDQTDFNH